VSTPCPCGRGGAFGVLPYDRCCGRYLDDPTTPAPDAESLMRSRYTAFARSRRDYLLATWGDAHRPARLDLDPGITWLGLEVLDRMTAGDDAEVEFVARFRQVEAPGREQRLHERSRFVRRHGRWYYLDGSLR
jgi:SEC-C motif domain protein